MKITHICLNAPVTDGWTYQDNLLPKYHKKTGYDVSVITSKYTRDKEGEIVIDKRTNYINENGIKTIRIKNKYGTSLKSKFKMYENLYEELIEEKPDIVFVHGVQFLNIRDIVKFLKKYPETLTYVDNHADYSNSATNWFSKNILHRVIWRRCAKLIEPYTTRFYGVLPARVDFLKNVYKIPERKLDLLLLGIDDEKLIEAQSDCVRNEIRKKYGIEPNDFLIMTGGKIDNAKKQTLLLMRAVQKINNTKMKLIVFGSVIDDLKEEINELADGVAIQYIGWITPEDSYKYFYASDLVVFPGRHSVYWELVVGLGIPLIVKHWEGTTHIDIGGNCDFLYKDTVEEIQKKIINITEDMNKYIKMKKVATGKLKKEFLYSSIAKKSIM